MPLYNDIHRLFLQSMMSHRVLCDSRALAILQTIHDTLNVEVDGITSEKDLKKVIKLINEEINSLNMEIRTAVSETTSEKYFVLVNTVSTPINLTMAKYTEGERQFFKKIVDEIVGSDSGRISSIACLNMCEQFNKSKAVQEDLIKQFIDEEWLCDEEGKLSLSVRSISELAPYLRNTYKDFLQNCELCKDLVFQGYRCKSCPTVCHQHCIQMYAKRSSNQGAISCPGQDCDAVLQNIDIFATMDEDDVETRERFQPGPTRKKTRSTRQ